MRTRVTVLPGERGAKQLQEHYGDQLVCVRYRYDEQLQKRYKTVELIIKEYDWQPPENPAPSERIVQIRVGAAEKEIRHYVKQAGGRWNPQCQVWELRHDRVIAMGVQGRIVGEKSL